MPIRLTPFIGGAVICLIGYFPLSWGQTYPPVVTHQYNDKSVNVGLRSLVNIEDLRDDCIQDVLLGTIDKLEFLGASTRVQGFRLKTQSKQYLYMNLNSGVYDRLDAVDASWITRSLKEGRLIFVSYQQCGASGRFYSVRDIFFR